MNPTVSLVTKVEVTTKAGVVAGVVAANGAAAMVYG